MPVVVKRTGERRDYDRVKLRASMKLALRKRPVSSEKIENALDSIEQKLLTLGEKEVASSRIGDFVLAELKHLDSVAYVRFASVYFNIENPEGFRGLVRELEDVKKHA